LSFPFQLVFPDWVLWQPSLYTRLPCFVERSGFSFRLFCRRSDVTRMSCLFLRVTSSKFQVRGGFAISRVPQVITSRPLEVRDQEQAQGGLKGLKDLGEQQKSKDEIDTLLPNQVNPGNRCYSCAPTTRPHRDKTSRVQMPSKIFPHLKVKC